MLRGRSQDRNAIQDGTRQARDEAAIEKADIFNRASGVIKGLTTLAKLRKSDFTFSVPDHLDHIGQGYAIKTNIPTEKWHGEQKSSNMLIHVSANGDMQVYGDDEAVDGKFHYARINNRFMGGPLVTTDTLTVKATDPEAHKKVVSFVSKYAQKRGLVR